jgi:hypothetical protein
MATLSFVISHESREDAIRALKFAMPSLKNVDVLIASGSFKIPNDKARVAMDTLKPFAVQISMEIMDESVDAEEDADVKAAEERLAKSLKALEVRLNDRANKMAAKLLDIAADLIEKL